MKKLIVIVLCIAMALLLIACENKSVPSSDEQNGQSLGSNVEIPNPFVDCKTLEEAQELAGFDFTRPDRIPEGFTENAIRVMKGKMIEIIYTNGNDEIRIRKGIDSEDISGDNNDYSETGTVSVGNLQVTMKGDGDSVNVASWFNDGYAFSITLNPGGEGLHKTVVSDMVRGIQ